MGYGESGYDRLAAWHGKRIKALRVKKCLTLRAFCDELERASNFTLTLTPGAVCRWEKGQRRVALRFRPFVADVLGVDHTILFERPPFEDAA